MNTMKAWDFSNLIVEFAQDCANRARGYAESAEAAESDKYRARYASDSATMYANRAAKSAAESKELCCKSADLSLVSAQYAAEYVELSAEFAGTSEEERRIQLAWWENKIAELRTSILEQEIIDLINDARSNSFLNNEKLNWEIGNQINIVSPKRAVCRHKSG